MCWPWREKYIIGSVVDRVVLHSVGVWLWWVVGKSPVEGMSGASIFVAWGLGREVGGGMWVVGRSSGQRVVMGLVLASLSGNGDFII